VLDPVCIMPLSWASAADEDGPGCCSYSVVGSTVLRFGGFDGKAETNAVAALTESGTWQQLAATGDIPAPRARAAAVGIDATTMLVWGGAILEGDAPSRFGPNKCADDGSLHLFDVPTRSWRTVSPVGWRPPPRQGHTATSLGGGAVIIVAGGVQGEGAGREDDDGRTLLLQRRRSEQ